MPNRLARETSPYLLQHAENPVDWYAWGPEALERARTEDRPILLSIGYSACHWCHVMEHESFEDPEIASVMNERFVNVKVDREERPDVDSIYMTAVQQMTGHGGWPLTMFLTPDGRPFFGGTYYPPAPRHGLPSFRQVLLGVSEAYRERRGELEQSADGLAEMLRQHTRLQPGAGTVDPSLLDTTVRALHGRFDTARGGFGSAPKFPQPMLLELLLRYAHRTGSAEASVMAETTLVRMAAGGMYDHLGGGFHRYSVDAHWLVPHFEKMLYDNALLSRVYLYAHQATRKEEYRRVAEEVLDYVVREMRSREGAFYSTQDADSEGEEGLFYLWSPEEIDAVMGAEDGALVRHYWGVTATGNFEGKNILHVTRPVEEVAAEAGVEPARLEEALRRARSALYEARAKRIWPGRDEKVLTAWNGMMMASFADAAWILRRDDYRRVAEESAEFLLSNLRGEKGLLRTYKDGEAKIQAFLEDHALLADGMLALYRATGEVRWVREAGTLADSILDRFWEEEEGTFYDAASDGEALVVRPRDVFDGATPSGTSAAVRVLQELSVLTGEERYARVSVRTLEGLAPLVPKIPMAFGNLLCAVDFQLAPPREVAVVGRSGDADTELLLRTLSARYLPGTVIAVADPGGVEAAADAVPLLQGRAAVGGRATAYVCERFACRRPVHTAEELAAELEATPGRP